MALPDEQEIRAALGRLVAHGIESVWLPEAQVLLELPAVRENIERLGPDRAADALREALCVSVESLGQSQYRHLLTIVLGLEPAFAEMSAGQKREIAGRQFRGGSKPVSAGTIRQYHEPKALDELAAVLCGTAARAPGPPGESAGEHPLSAIEWHPVLHNLWAGERLVFWRLSFGRYDPKSARARVKEAMESVEVSSWVAYEATGGFDVLIRAWLPAAVSQADFEAAILDELGDMQLHFDFFAVDKLVRHWPWVLQDQSMGEPSRDLLEGGVPSRDIESINAGADPERLREYRQRNIVAPVLEEKGIGFMVAVAPAGPAIVPALAQQGAAEAAMADLLGRVEGKAFSGLSLYAGSGFARYLVLGRVRPASFSELEESLVRPLGEIAGRDGGRTYTFILSASAPLARVERMPISASKPAEPSAEELLHQDEDAHFEAIAMAFDESSERSAGFTAHLARVVTGFLNADGGTIVIGAAETARLQHGDRVAELFEGAPEVGKYAMRGIGAKASEDVDGFHRRLMAVLGKKIEPDPRNFFLVRFEQVAGRTACVLTVPRVAPLDPRPWFYCREGRSGARFFLRRGSMTAELAGAEADAYKAQKSGGRGAASIA